MEHRGDSIHMYLKIEICSQLREVIPLNNRLSYWKMSNSQAIQAAITKNEAHFFFIASKVTK